MTEKKALLNFARWVAFQIFSGDFDPEFFCEMACRKLCILGIVKKNEDGNWEYDGG